MEIYDFEGQTLSISSTLLLKSDTIYRNGIIKTNSIMPNIMQAYGSLGWSSQGLVENGKVTLDFVDGIPNNVSVYLISNKILSPLDSGRLSYWANLVKRENRILHLDRFIPEGIYRVYFPIQPQNIILENLTIIGPAQYGLRVYLGNQIEINNVKTIDTKYTAISLESVTNSSVSNLVARKADHATGAAYGVAIVGGCNGVSVTSSKFSDFRHGVTVGGTEGSSDNIVISNNTAEACSDAGIDVHPNAHSVVITSNIVNINSTVTDQSGDGICVQNVSSIVSNNIIQNAKREAILVQPLVSINSEHVVNDNIIKNCEFGVCVDKHYGTGLSLSVTGNIMTGTRGRECLVQGTNTEGKATIKGEISGRHSLILDNRLVKTNIRHNVDQVTVYE